MMKKEPSLLLLIAEALEVIADCLRLMDYERRAEEKLREADGNDA